MKKIDYVGDPKAGAKEIDHITSGARPVTMGEVMDLVRRAGERHTEFTVTIRKLMTQARARRIRQLRVEQDTSWRAIASLTYIEWGAIKYWHPISNQIAGIALCEVAADVLGEVHWE